jgi:hypothetical protein
VRGLRVLQPGYAPSTTQVFTTRYTDFLKSLAPDTLRTMELTATNNNTTAEWAQRPKPTDATYTRAGVPWELLVQLCNAVRSNVWVCVPGHAGDDYVRQLAALLRDKLAPDLKIYVEYSNEVWNQGFEQGRYNLAQAKAEVAAGGSDLAYDGETDPYVWADRRTARRLVRISDVFKTVWADAGLPSPINGRVRCSLGSQAQMPTRVDPMLKYVADRYGRPADRFWSVGIAVYFTLNKYQDQFVGGKWVTADAGLTVDQVIEGMDLSVRTYEDQRKFAQQLTHAAAYGLRLDAYELGLDTKGPFNVDAKRSANLDPRIGPLVERFVDAFHGQGGDLANWYTLGARGFGSSFGTWSITESLAALNQPKEQAFRALRGLSPTPTPTPTATSLRSSADALVRDGTYAGTNYGASAALGARLSSYAGQRRESYLRFDLTGVPSAGAITSAVLRLYGHLSAAGSVPVGVYSVASDAWTESGVRWTGRPARGSTALATKTVASTAAGWYEFDVTAYVRARKAAGAASVDLALAATAYATPWATFASDEAAANRPALVVV